jgi:Uma2 family endonuclease
MTTAPALPAVYKLTAADWVRFPDDGLRYEILGGELHVSPPPTTGHQRISGHLYAHLREHLSAAERGEVFYAPTGVRLSDHDVAEPDLVVVLAEHAGRVGEQAIDGPPDLVVEILSPGTAGRDLGEKRDLYERSGVAEYWIVDPVAAAVEVLVLRAGRYARFGLFRRSDRLRSALLPGLEVPLVEILTA